MATAIKKFFQKRKLDVKFKHAGQGQRMNEASSPSSSSVSQGQRQVLPSPPVRPNAESQRASQHAAQAAISRLESKNMPPPKAVMRTNMTKMMEEEKAKQKESAAAAAAAISASSGPEEKFLESAPMLQDNSILFKCPLVGPVVLPHEAMDAHIEEFLRSQYEEEPEMTAALMIHTLNRSPEAVAAGIDILCRYLDNIIASPDEPKYRKIRRENRTVQQKLLVLAGAEEMLLAAGFEQSEDGEFYEMPDSIASDVDRLKSLKEVLLAAEPIRAELDHNVCVFRPSTHASRITVPDSFYSASADEIRREQEAKREAVEKLGMLRTREMRERDRLKELRRYRYALIRVRLPDDILWQGTFKAHSPFTCVVDCLRESLMFDWLPFKLTTQTGHQLTDETGSVAELGLAPAALINLSHDATMIAEIAAQQGPVKSYLKADLMERIQSL